MAKVASQNMLSVAHQSANVAKRNSKRKDHCLSFPKSMKEMAVKTMMASDFVLKNRLSGRESWRWCLQMLSVMMVILPLTKNE